MNSSRIFFLLSASLLLLSCGQKAESSDSGKPDPLSLELKASSTAFNEYWYNGLAELNTFQLSQARYGEIREGELAMIFVTEDFLIGKQVKQERPSDAEVVSVLKMNMDRQFITGIYDYSMMTSVFTPITQHRWQDPIKVSTSSQEWCGHSWTQLNQTQAGYHYHQFSYFEAEADQELDFEKVLIEDGIWNQIRLAPEKIDTGSMQMLPATQFIRLSHLRPKPYEVQISRKEYLGEDMPGEDLKMITLSYPSLERSLEIIYESAAPHFIAGWRETTASGKDKKDSPLTTVAKRKAQLRIDYWNKKGVKDSTYRETLKLKYY